jgi:voltage-gated potassium channel
MLSQLFVGSLMIVVSTLFHIAMLLLLIRLLPKTDRYLKKFGITFSKFSLLSISVLSVIFIHTVEIWAWAFLYLELGEFSELRDSLYFSTVTATTLGYGDVVLSDQNRLLSSFESMGGLILFGLSTAFFISLMKSLFEEQMSTSS